MKITQQSLPYCFLLLALVATVVTVGEADVCSDVVGVGHCEPTGNCYNDCVRRHPGGKASCEGDTCKCYYECRPTPKKCNLGLGRCSQACNNDCCASKCSSSHPGGVGYCDDSLGSQYSLCQCQYPC